MQYIIGFSGAFAILRKATIIFVMYFFLSVCLLACLSVHPYGTTRLPLDRNLCQYFSKICWENSSFVKIWQEQRVHYGKTNCKFL